MPTLLSLHIAPQRYTLPATAVPSFLTVSFDRQLDAGETLTGTPTVTPSDVGVIADTASVNGSAVSILGKTVAAGRTVRFRLLSGLTVTAAGAPLELLVSCATSAGSTKLGKALLDVVAA